MRTDYFALFANLSFEELSKTDINLDNIYHFSNSHIKILWEKYIDFINMKYETVELQEENSSDEESSTSEYDYDNEDIYIGDIEQAVRIERKYVF
jgi:hypothetical protein